MWRNSERLPDKPCAPTGVALARSWYLKKRGYLPGYEDKRDFLAPQLILVGFSQPSPQPLSPSLDRSGPTLFVTFTDCLAGLLHSLRVGAEFLVRLNARSPLPLYICRVRV